MVIKTIQPSTVGVGVVNCSLTSSEASKVVEQHSTADTGASNLLIKGDGDIEFGFSSMHQETDSV